MSRDYAQELARIALDIQAIKLNPTEPFTWASGYRMPIYNDNRLLLGSFEHRALIAEGLEATIRRCEYEVEVVAGTSTAGISPGTTLADRLRTPFIYVRDKAKGHGLRNRIEGILREGQKVVMIEDLISTGGSSIDAILGVREAGGNIDLCCSIFSYDLEESAKQFREIHCRIEPLLKFDTLLKIAIEQNYISSDQERLLNEWRNDPFGWGERHGFPRVVKDK